jgi:penicillin-binding protein 1A
MSYRIFRRKTYRESKKRKRVSFFVKITGGLFLFLVFCFFVLFIYYAKDLPRPEKFTEKQFAQSTKIYDRTGKVLLYEIYGEEKRTLVSLQKVPDLLKQAVIVTEDVNFYHHFGVDFKGILRSILINLKLKEAMYGGSTIPQQLIRSTFFSTEKTIGRKFREIVLALELDRRYPKDQILEWYLNQIPFGQNAYGVEAASQTYFEKPIENLSLPEIATLAALIQAPSHLSPFGPHKDELMERKDYVLGRMLSYDFITEEQFEAAKKEEVNFVESPVKILAPYFTLWVKQQITDKYGEDFLIKQGLKVYTSLDWEMQQEAERVVKEGVERNKAYNAHNAGLVAIDPKTGEVLAMTVGTGDYYAPSYPENCISGVDCLFDPKFNVTIGTKESPGRQPGSAFKPFIYATAFKKGYNDQTMVSDEETNFGVWGEKEYIPQNYDGKFRGLITLRQALSQSLNVPSIKVLYLIGSENKINALTTNNFIGQENIITEGLKQSIETAQDMGITTLDRPLSSYGPAIVLGGGEVKLLDITSAFGVFATEGIKVEPVSILKIEDYQGKILEENKKGSKRVLPSEVAKLVTDILSDNNARAPMFGLQSHLYFENYKVAAKTGTTDDFRDCWTIGYVPSLAVGVWVGNNNNESMTRKQPAATVAGPIFHEFLEKFLPDLPN